MDLSQPDDNCRFLNPDGVCTESGIPCPHIKDRKMQAFCESIAAQKLDRKPSDEEQNSAVAEGRKKLAQTRFADDDQVDQDIEAFINRLKTRTPTSY